MYHQPLSTHCLQRKYQALKDSTVRKRLFDLGKLCDSNDWHLSVRNILAILANALLGVGDCKLAPSGVLDVGGIRTLMAEGRSDACNFFANIFGLNLLPNWRERILGPLEFFRVGLETTNQADNVILFGPEDDDYRNDHEKLFQQDPVFPPDQLFEQFRAHYLSHGLKAGNDDESQFQNQLVAQRGRLCGRTPRDMRSVNEFLYSSLLLNQIWFAKPESFNDPLEPERVFSDSPFGDALDRSVREAGVLCLCKRNDNLPMWSYYGNALKGLAVGYDLATLISDLKPVFPSNDDLSPRWRYVYDMAYRDDGLSLIQEMDLLVDDEKRAREYQKMFATKAAGFIHEGECRVVLPPSPDSTLEYSWSGHGLYQHKPEAVKEIVFGERMAEQDRRVVMKVLEGRNIRFFNAVRDRSEFKIRLELALGETAFS